MESFTNLEAWKVGLLLVQEVYAITKKFPRTELFALTSQIQRSSTSVLANLAEGCGKYTFPDRAARFVIARGECTETKAFLLIAVALGFITEKDTEQAMEHSDHAGRLLSGLIKAARNRIGSH